MSDATSRCSRCGASARHAGAPVTMLVLWVEEDRAREVGVDFCTPCDRSFADRHERKAYLRAALVAGA
jgi:hypothetical protein